jgi:putative transposase
LSEHGVPIAPRTYYAYLKRAPSKRALSDLVLTRILADFFEPYVDDKGRIRKHPESLYGNTKMWAHLNHEAGIQVAKCTVERLKRLNGWEGVRRNKRVHTTISDPTAARAADLVDRDFTAAAPNELFVADFTYVRLACGRFAYSAFVIDAFAGLIVGWECSLNHTSAFVERALRQAVELRRNQGHPLPGHTIHHSDAGSEYSAVHFGEQLFLSGLLASVGSVADAYDNALAETSIGLYKTEAVRPDSPFRTGPINTLADLEKLTSEWVDWYNNHRLMHRIGLIPPARAEANHYRQERDHNPVAALK